MHSQEQYERTIISPWETTSIRLTTSLHAYNSLRRCRVRNMATMCCAVQRRLNKTVQVADEGFCGGRATCGV